MFVKLTHEKGFPVYVNVGQAAVLEPAGKGTRVIFNWVMHEGREKEIRVMVNEAPDQVVAMFNAEYAATMRGQDASAPPKS
jgi:16S rRNA U516 pseudouridylate synthase RsuA-like enzyme